MFFMMSDLPRLPLWVLALSRGFQLCCYVLREQLQHSFLLQSLRRTTRMFRYSYALLIVLQNYKASVRHRPSTKHICMALSFANLSMWDWLTMQRHLSGVQLHEMRFLQLLV